MNKVKVARLISEHRKKLGITQRELAEQLHISGKSVSKWECAQNLPDVDMMCELARILQLSIDNFFVDENELYDSYYNNDWNTLYDKNNKFINYLRIMELPDVDETLILTCILNDYYFSYKETIDFLIQDYIEETNTYPYNRKKHNKDIFLNIQNALRIANIVIQRGQISVEAIEEANFYKHMLESEMVDLICLDICNVRNFDSIEREKYNQLLKYMLIKCNMKECQDVLNKQNNIRGYKRILAMLHVNYFDYVDQYFDDDALILNGEYIYSEDYEIDEVFWNLRDSICIVDHEIYKALKNTNHFDDKEIIAALRKVGFWAAVLTKTKGM